MKKIVVYYLSWHQNGQNRYWGHENRLFPVSKKELNIFIKGLHRDGITDDKIFVSSETIIR